MSTTNNATRTTRWLGDHNAPLKGVDITISYKKKGKVVGPFDFGGRAWTLEDGKAKIASSAEIETSPLFKDGHFDLTGIPVISISVKKMRAVFGDLDGKGKFHEFQGAFHFFGYDEAMAFHDGELVFTSSAVLAGTEKINQHRLVEAWTAPRWEGGYLVRDRVWQTHYGQNVRIIKRSVHHRDLEALVGHVSHHVGYHANYVFESDALKCGGPMAAELHKAGQLWRRKYILCQYENRQVPKIPFVDSLKAVLRQEFGNMGIHHLAEIPAGFSVSLERVMPALWAERDTVGTLEVPGVGRKEIKTSHDREENGYSQYDWTNPYITLTEEEFIAVPGDWDFLMQIEPQIRIEVLGRPNPKEQPQSRARYFGWKVLGRQNQYSEDVHFSNFGTFRDDVLANDWNARGYRGCFWSSPDAKPGMHVMKTCISPE